jgi:hypothetical protein
MSGRGVAGGATLLVIEQAVQIYLYFGISEILY